MALDIPLNLITAHLFFVDIVGLSDPSMSTKIQIKKIETLTNSLKECATFKTTPLNMILTLPTGDGMVIGFLQGPQLPLNLAIELHQKLTEYNRGKIPGDTVRVRIGIHSGHVYVVNDILNNKNIWGPGIIIARRVMDIGDDGHILLSPRAAEDLRELSDQYKQIIKPLHDYSIKHGQTLLVYSACGQGYGNPRVPAKHSFQRSRMSHELIKRRKTTLYPYMEVNISIEDPERMHVRYKRVYEIANISDEPIYEVLHGIATDVEKSFGDLNVSVYDENNRALKITSINLDKPHQKEFTTKFNKPIVKGMKGRRLTLEYEVEEVEKYFENYFGINCQKFVTTIDYPEGIDPPTVYEVNVESDEKKRLKIQPVIEKKENARILSRWVKRDVTQGQSFRFEWT